MTTNTVVYIIDTLRKSRSLDTKLSYPKGLEEVADSNKSVLQWNYQSLLKNALNQIVYIGSYHIEKVIQVFPCFKFKYCTEMAIENAKEEYHNLILKSDIPNLTENILIIPSHIIFLPDALKILTTKSNQYGFLDDQWVGTYVTYKDFLTLTDKNLQNLNFVNLNGLCANIYKEQAVAQLVMQGKAKTLDNIKDIVKTAQILDGIRINIHEWQKDKNFYINKIKTKFIGSTLVVRSATATEDGFTTSHAGFFDSILDVYNSDQAIENAVNRVIQSYSKNGRLLQNNDEVLIQKQVCNLKLNGVMFTKNPRDNSPYFCVNIDYTPGSKDGVTSGTKNVKNITIAWNAPYSTLEPILQRIVLLAKELMHALHISALDIEFGVDQENILYLFQVRPLALPNLTDDTQINSLKQRELLDSIVLNASQVTPNHIFGVMPDWNPAEMIGIKPKPLAFSLYHELITNTSWSIARMKMGYKDLSPIPLMRNIGGSPYIDVNLSLSSFLPKEISSCLCEPWVNFCLSVLKENPNLHDKIEFDVAITCLSPNWEKHQSKLKQAGFSNDEVKDFRLNFKNLTQNILSFYSKPNNWIDAFPKNYYSWLSHIGNNHNYNDQELCQHIHKICYHTQRAGVVPFSIYARMAFIGLTFIREFVEIECITQTEADAFLSSIPTVSTEFIEDQNLYSKGEISLDSILKKYGHLRPNSYDITSKNYQEDYETIFSKKINYPKTKKNTLQDSLGIIQPKIKSLQEVLNKLDIDLNINVVIHFIVKSIQLREKQKFDFMKSVNAILCLIKMFGVNNQLDAEKLSFIPVQYFTNRGIQNSDPGHLQHILKTISYNQKSWHLTKNINLPELICHPNELFVFESRKNQPNFITQKIITGKILHLDDLHVNKKNVSLDDHIILLTSADPGFDWIFGHKIKGLITAFGGMASHMAIRCSEFELPAMIGCGQKYFESLTSADSIKLDCENKIVEAFHA